MKENEKREFDINLDSSWW